MPYGHRVLQVDFAVDNTSYEAVNMRKDDGFVNLILSLVLAKLIVDWKFYPSQLRLYN